MKIETTEKQDRVVEAMRDLNEWSSPKEIAEKSGVNVNSVKSYLERFIHAGLVRKKGRGRYGLVEKVGMKETSDEIKSNASRRPVLTVGPADNPWLVFYQSVVEGKWVLVGEFVRTLNMPLDERGFDMDLAAQGEIDLQVPEPSLSRQPESIEESS